MFRKSALLLIFLAGSLGAQLSLPGGKPALPTARVVSLVPTGLSLRDITFALDVAVKNPYPLGLNLSGVGLKFSVEGAQVFEARTQGSFTIPGGRENTNRFLVVLPFEALGRLVRNYQEKDFLDTQIDVTISIPLPKLPGLPQDFVVQSRSMSRIPAVKPVIAVTGFKVSPPDTQNVAQALKKAGRNLDPAGVSGMFGDILAGRPARNLVNPSDLDLNFQVEFSIEIENMAKAPLNFPELEFQLDVDSQSLVSGRTAEVSRRGNKTLVRVVNTISSKSLSSAVRSAFTKGQGIFRARGTAKVGFPGVGNGLLELKFDESGEFRLR